MLIYNSRRELSQWVASAQKNNKKIGFIPTMGALHSGHISLIDKSKEENDYTICSIFVNPTQFDNKDDLIKYPRNKEKDITLLLNHDCDALFFPEVEEMYPSGEKSLSFNFCGLESQMEGAFRDGHFDGVATIVKRFFEIVQPDKAYFGEKDFQQLRIIEELVNQMKIKTEIVPMPIFRESDGLAMSSRNTRLTEDFRKEAPFIFETLNWVKKNHLKLSLEEINDKVEAMLDTTNLELEYFIIADEKTLLPVTNFDKKTNIRAFIAAYAGEIRLIDNLRIK